MELMKKYVEVVPKILLSPREAAHLLSISEATLWRLTHRDRLLPFLKVGHLVRYRRQDLEDFSHRMVQKAQSGGEKLQ